MQANTWTLWNAKVGTWKYDTFAPTYKEIKILFTNDMEHKFYSCHNDLKC